MTARGTVALALCAAATAFAQTYPVKPLRLIVPFPAGGGSDVIGRIVAQKLGDRFGQQVVVDNRAGAGGNIAAEISARAAPDGYTLFLLNSANLIAPSLYQRIAYDPVRDFAPITQIAYSPLFLVVHPSAPIKTVGDPFAIMFGGPLHSALSATRAAGSMPIRTVGSPGGRITPPT